MSNADNTTETVAPKAGMRGWVRALFIVSLTMNLLVLGVVAGGVIGHSGHPPRPMISDISMGPFTEALSRADRDALRHAAEAEGAGFRDMRRAARADFTRLVAALKADPWNEAEVRSVIEAHRARTLDRIEIGERLMFGRIAAMTPEERKGFAERLEAGLRRGPRDLPRAKP